MMFCPDCGQILDDVDVGDPCPECGGTRRSANAPAGSASGTVAALDPTAVGHSQLVGGERIDVGSTAYRSSSVANAMEDRQRLDGDRPQNEQDVEAVCGLLREALGLLGENYGRFRVPLEVDDVDCIADGLHGNSLRVQVTRVERKAWAEMARNGSAESTETNEQRADAIIAAVMAKRLPPQQRRQLVLALDAVRTPAYVRSDVVDVFRDKYGSAAAQLGYQAIWLVGPSATLTVKLC